MAAAVVEDACVVYGFMSRHPLRIPTHVVKSDDTKIDSHKFMRFG